MLLMNKIKYFNACFKVSDLLKDIKLVKDFLKLLIKNIY